MPKAAVKHQHKKQYPAVLPAHRCVHLDTKRSDSSTSHVRACASRPPPAFVRVRLGGLKNLVPLRGTGYAEPTCFDGAQHFTERV